MTHGSRICIAISSTLGLFSSRIPLAARSPSRLAAASPRLDVGAVIVKLTGCRIQVCFQIQAPAPFLIPRDPSRTPQISPRSRTLKLRFRRRRRHRLCDRPSVSDTTRAKPTNLSSFVSGKGSTSYHAIFKNPKALERSHRNNFSYVLGRRSHGHRFAFLIAEAFEGWVRS